MEVTTMVLDGKEYVLIPKDVFDKSVGIVVETTPEIQEKDVMPEVAATFIPEPPKQTVMVVDTMPGVQKAQGSTYGFGQRLKKRALVPEDVMVLRTGFEEMPETPEIARNDFKDKTSAGLQKAKFGFYGPGAERDVG